MLPAPALNSDWAREHFIASCSEEINIVAVLNVYTVHLYLAEG